jgi:hypothetical protein
MCMVCGLALPPCDDESRDSGLESRCVNFICTVASALAKRVANANRQITTNSRKRVELSPPASRDLVSHAWG